MASPAPASTPKTVATAVRRQLATLARQCEKMRATATTVDAYAAELEYFHRAIETRAALHQLVGEYRALMKEMSMLLNGQHRTDFRERERALDIRFLGLERSPLPTEEAPDGD
jgi:uncharacterized sporulation protein YeaH/YhbH (DUF444 family)